MPRKGTVNNPHGRPKGSKNTRTKQWEALHESITGMCAEKFEKHLIHLWETNPDKATQVYIQMLEYFKPKQQRVESISDSEVIVKVVHES